MISAAQRGSDKAGVHRIRNRAWLALILITSTIAAVGGFVVANVIGESPRVSLDKADTKIVVTAPVEIRAVDASATYSGRIVAGGTKAVVPVGLPELPIVTRRALKIGDTVRGGGFLGAVAGVPVFALIGTLPLYRDLRPADSGDDVRALQGALSRAGFAVWVTGQVDSSTIDAVSRLFERAGYELPSESVPSPTKKHPDAKRRQALIPVSAFVGVARSGLRVVSVATVNSRVGEKNPLVAVQTSADAVVFRASPDQVADLKAGGSVTVRTPTAVLKGVITSIGSFQSGGDGAVPGRDVRVGTDIAALEKAGVGTSVVIAGLGAVVRGLAVPSVAVREDARGSYVLVRGHANGRRRVDVTVNVYGGGWASVESKNLHRGDPVITS